MVDTVSLIAFLLCRRGPSSYAVAQQSLPLEQAIVNKSSFIARDISVPFAVDCIALVLCLFFGSPSSTVVD